MIVVGLEQFTRAHDEIERSCAELVEIGRRLHALPPHLVVAARTRCLELVEPLEAHMQLDERLLFREVCARLGDPLATASMSYDHRAIRDWIRRLHAADPHDAPALQELVYGLAALIRVHVWKERELYLAMLASGSWPAAV